MPMKFSNLSSHGANQSPKDRHRFQGIPMKFPNRGEDQSSDDLQGLATDSKGGRFKRKSFHNKSRGRMALGMSFIAQQFATASAEGTGHSSHSTTNNFDLIGLISAFGITAATESLSYSALNDDSSHLTGHIGPGSLSVASLLLKATGSRLAEVLAFSGGRDANQLLQLDFPDGLHYIGLNSYTECSVLNTVGASIVREHQSLWKEKQGLEQGTAQKLAERKGRSAEREVKVITLEICGGKDKRTKEEMRVLLEAGKEGTVLLGWLPLCLTVGVMASCCSCNEWFVAGLIALGTLGMMLAAMGLRLCLFKYSKPEVPTCAPVGNCLVVDYTDPDTLHIITGEEAIIQTLFQRKIDSQVSLAAKFVLFLAASVLYFYVIASIICMPKVSVSGQILYAIANLIGLVTDIVKASKSGKLGLAKKACEQFKIVPRGLVLFQNRTAAVAFVAKHAKDRCVLKSKKLLPCDGPVWQKWWEELAKWDGQLDDTGIDGFDALAEGEDSELLKVLLHDMMDGLKA